MDRLDKIFVVELRTPSTILGKQADTTVVSHNRVQERRDTDRTIRGARHRLKNDLQLVHAI